MVPFKVVNTRKEIPLKLARASVAFSKVLRRGPENQEPS